MFIDWLKDINKHFNQIYLCDSHFCVFIYMGMTANSKRLLADDRVQFPSRFPYALRIVSRDCAVGIVIAANSKRLLAALKRTICGFPKMVIFIFDHVTCF